MMDTASAEKTPALVSQSQGHHQGEGYVDGRTKEERENYEWYNNFDSTYTMKKVVWVKTTNVDEEHIHSHRTVIKIISKEEYFKRTLAGTLYHTDFDIDTRSENKGV